ncbi:MAG: AmmeMemoRadiSam system protein A [Candidatus Thermoplasmatota archaeon]|nr:AmmeMemoRadiSam system protein A [Candidatus Thermoplasmatota archaeon]
MATRSDETAERAKLLTSLARQTVESYVREGKTLIVHEKDPILERKVGVFVTIKRDGDLRGCIGYTEPPWPLNQTLIRAAIASATEDPRFRPVSPRELGSLEYEVTILTEPEQIDPTDAQDMQRIQIGKNGLMIESLGMRGLLLPQVAVEEGLNAAEFLDATCEKAGLSPGCWKSTNARVFLFEGIVYSETKHA